MPGFYRIDVRAGVVFTTLEGCVTCEDLLDHQRRLPTDPDFRPTMSQSVDARSVTEAAITPFMVRIVANDNVFAPGSRRALIPGDATASYGYARMFQVLRSQAGEVVQIFSTVEDAHRWLGLE